MPLSEEDLEISASVREVRGVCDICGEVRKLNKVCWIDKRIITHCSDLFICSDCEKELFIYDQAVHSSDHGLRFGDLRENGHNLNYKKISDIVKNSDWGEIQERANHKRILAKEWEDLDSALRED